MKTTLTADDPSGWYLCRRIHAKHLCCNWWDREHLRSSPLLGELNLSLYEDFRRLFTESDVAALREELTALRDEVKRLKSQPYVMRLADKPDCVGLWRNVVGQICMVETESDLDCYGGCPPYYYLGPIPVVVEQQPPRVVKVRCKSSGSIWSAIPSPCGKWSALINDDGKFMAYASSSDYEEVQS